MLGSWQEGAVAADLTVDAHSTAWLLSCPEPISEAVLCSHHPEAICHCRNVLQYKGQRLRNCALLGMTAGLAAFFGVALGGELLLFLFLVFWKHIASQAALSMAKAHKHMGLQWGCCPASGSTGSKVCKRAWQAAWAAWTLIQWQRQAALVALSL